MTHAAKSHDAIDRLTEIRERIESLIASEHSREECGGFISSLELRRLLSKLDAATLALETAIAIANAQSLLSKLARQSKVSDQDRMAIREVKEQLSRVA